MKIIPVLAALAHGGCAKSSGEIRGAYISPLQYQNYSCQQIGAELQRVSARANEAAGVQDDKARVMPVFCRVCAGPIGRRPKGKVERFIRYVKGSFWSRSPPI